MPINTQQVLKSIKPDIADCAKRCRKRGFASIFMLIFGFAGFGAGGALSAIVGLGFIALALIAFFCFPLGMVLTISNFNKASVLGGIALVTEQIQRVDTMPVAKAFPTYQAIDAEMLAEKLISTGNLKGYTLVGGCLFARESLYISEEDAKQICNEYRMSQNPMNGVAFARAAAVETMSTMNGYSFCPSCGAAVVQEGARYCPICGQKL